MKNLRTLMTGMGLGAGLMYLLDPNGGNRRRALARDQLVHLMHATEDAADTTARDLSNRSRGMLAEIRSLFEPVDVSDEVLEARVRERLGFLVSHPGSIEVEADQGRVTLSGPVLDYEVDGLLAGVARVRGVKVVENHLEIHERPYDVPGLQGKPGRRLGSGRPEFLQTNWSPTARLIAGATGGAMALRGMRRKGLTGMAMSAVGLGMLARGLTNQPLKRIVGVGAGRRAVDVQKTINVDAPVEAVFTFWSNFENFPQFMQHVHEVRDLGEGRSHWIVDGPGGIPIEWDAEVTKLVPNEILAWKTLSDDPIGHAGIIRFRPSPQGGTTIDIKMSYNPPAGMLGHAVARFFGSDPKSQMDADLVRFKSLIEVGKTTAHGEEVTREEAMNDERPGLGAGG